jgi:hypothetical protein
VNNAEKQTIIFSKTQDFRGARGDPAAAGGAVALDARQ